VRVLTDMKLGGRMAVKRIVANIATDHVVDAKAFYTDILGLNLVMDHGWIDFRSQRGRGATDQHRDRGRIRDASTRPLHRGG
jgi:catechol 2,3-dioxygenase-like lactoylglutathione lyase family enzyme